MNQIVEKALSCNIEESYRTLLVLHSEADDFQNVVISSRRLLFLLVKFS